MAFSEDEIKAPTHVNADEEQLEIAAQANPNYGQVDDQDMETENDQLLSSFDDLSDGTVFTEYTFAINQLPLQPRNCRTSTGRDIIVLNFLVFDCDNKSMEVSCFDQVTSKIWNLLKDQSYPAWFTFIGVKTMDNTFSATQASEKKIKLKLDNYSEIIFLKPVAPTQANGVNQVQTFDVIISALKNRKSVHFTNLKCLLIVRPRMDSKKRLYGEVTDEAQTFKARLELDMNEVTMISKNTAIMLHRGIAMYSLGNNAIYGKTDKPVFTLWCQNGYTVLPSNDGFDLTVQQLAFPAKGK